MGRFAGGPRTYMGIQNAGFSNMFTINAALVGNFVWAAEPLVEWAPECIRYVWENEYVRVSPMVEAEDEWGQPRQRGRVQDTAFAGQLVGRGGQHPGEGAGAC